MNRFENIVFPVLCTIHLLMSFRLLKSFRCMTSDNENDFYIVRIGVLVTKLQMENFHMKRCTS